MRLERKTVLLVSAIVEGALILAYVVWARLRPAPPLGIPGSEDVLLALQFCLPLLVFNFAFFGPLANRLSFLQGCRAFRDSIVRPLADALDPGSAFIVAALAGIGEELFFRGIFQTEFGLLVASLLFALLHFGPAIRSYLFIGSMYLLFGFYFGLMYDLTGSLWVPIISHATYDFVVLVVLRYGFPAIGVERVST
ncbi:MAG: CPBP family intramembrane metalloprotease [Bdellovibrionales bacterium]|nr:CPBP family intramembrane metalloprotease [Bdellovibrionales bacterium]